MLENFRVKKFNQVDVEVKGDNQNLHFRVKDISSAFQIPNLQQELMSSEPKLYFNGKHYIFNKVNNKRQLYITVEGMKIALAKYGHQFKEFEKWVESISSQTFSEYREFRWNELKKKNYEETLNQFLQQPESFNQKLSELKRKFIPNHIQLDLNSIHENPLLPVLVACLSKDPSKQTIDEKCQLEWLQKHVSPTIQKSSNIRLDANGNLTTKGITKSFDAFDPTTNTYYVLKYTRGNGGAQDNQYNDVKNFIKPCLMNQQLNFVFVLDGNYYTKSKLDELSQLCQNKIKIISCEMFQTGV